MTSFDKDAHKTQWIAVKHLSVIWAGAQRPLDQKRAQDIADNLDPDLLDDLVVTKANGSGIYHVIDGQTRRAAVQLCYGEDEQVPCRVLDITDPKRAAEVFVRINTGRKAPNAVEQFNVRVTAGYDAEVQVHAILDRLGYRVGRHTGAGVIQSPMALLSVYKSFGSGILKEALETIKVTWGDDSSAFAAHIIRGYSALIAEHRSHIDFKRLREVVGKAMTPGQLAGKAKYHHELTGASAANSIKHILIQTYNDKLRAGRLGV